jgi:hypothetical protein
VVGGWEFVRPWRGETVCQALSGGDCRRGRCLSDPFGGRLPERALWDRGDFWGSEMARPKGK